MFFITTWALYHQTAPRRCDAKVFISIGNYETCNKRANKSIKSSKTARWTVIDLCDGCFKKLYKVIGEELDADKKKEKPV